MTIKGSGRAVLILATGLLVCAAGPSPAAANADDNATAGGTAAGFVPASPEPASSEPASPESNGAAGESVAVKKHAKYGSHRWKPNAHHESGRLALKSSTAKKVHAANVAPDDGGTSVAPPRSAANAYAQIPSEAPVDTPADNARAMAAWANHILQSGPDSPTDAPRIAETEAVSPTQLNDVDRTLPQSAPPAPPRIAMASADTPVEPAKASSNESSPWDRASLIGKIFMGFGGLLTLASAVRMFMA